MTPPTRGPRRVVIESPYAGDVEANVAYAWEAVADSLRRDEAPFAGHLLYTKVLDDGKALERERGIQAHLAWLRAADLVAVYADLGISPGMRRGIEAANEAGVPVVYRYLHKESA